jgi:hypothetical protein
MTHDLFEHDVMNCQRIDASLTQAKRISATRDQPRRRFRISAREERDVVPLGNEFLC